MSKKKGFTLLEVLIVLIIMGILAGGFMLISANMNEKTEAVKIVTDMKTLSKASLMYFTDHAKWPSHKENIEQYLDRDLLETGNVSYDLTYLADTLYIQASLSDKFSQETKDKLSQMAKKTGLLQKKDNFMERYTSDNAVYTAVNYSHLIPGNTDKEEEKEEEETPFSVSFNSPEDMDKFTKLTGDSNLEISDNSLVTTGEKDYLYSFGDADWTDYRVDLTATYDNKKKQGGYGIYYRSDGKEKISGYVFQYSPERGDKFIVRKVENGVEKTTIATVKIKDVMGKDFDIMGTPHDISIMVKGSQHIIKVDGVTVLSFTDSTYSQGSAGLGSIKDKKNGQTTFDSISISEL